MKSSEHSLFSYKKGSSFLHKCPAWAKILFIPIINILFLCLPPVFSIILVCLQFILACCLRFTFKEQFTDLKPVLFYAVIVFFMQILMWLFGGQFLAEEGWIVSLKNNFSWESEKETVFLLVKIFAVMQSASLVFKTSTSLEIRDGIGKLFGQSSLLTNALFMFLNFIPMVSKIWEQSKRAWIARGGKENIRMYMTLLPVLFSVGMKKAYNTSKAILIRK